MVVAEAVEEEEQVPRTIREPVRKAVAKTVALPSAMELPMIPEDEFPWAADYNAGLAAWWERTKSVLQFSLESQIVPVTQEQLDFINKQMENQG